MLYTILIFAICSVIAHLVVHNPPRSFWALMLSLYYRHINFVGSRVEDDIATIVVANHANGFIDPFVLQVALGKRLVRTIRADWLQHWLVKWFVHLIGAVPLAPKGKGRLNQSSFSQLVHDMGKGKWVVIFPEGLSHNRSKPRPFKKGAAYIAEQYIKQTGKPVRILQVALFYGEKSRMNSDIWVTVAGQTVYDPQQGIADKDQAVSQWQENIQDALPGPIKTAEKKQITWLAHSLSAFTHQATSLTSIKAILQKNSQLTALHCWLTQANIELDVLRYHKRIREILFRFGLELTIFVSGLPFAVIGLLCHAPMLIIHYWLTRQHSTAEDKWASHAYIIGIPLYLAWWLSIGFIFHSFWIALAAVACGLYSLFYWKTWAQRIRVLVTTSQALFEPKIRNQILATAESAISSLLNTPS
jgi:1-acyl-sn-glycerol-3-phosphate acyltransferase